MGSSARPKKLRAGLSPWLLGHFLGGLSSCRISNSLLLNAWWGRFIDKWRNNVNRKKINFGSPVIAGK
jgi:hypothetical protein